MSFSDQYQADVQSLIKDSLAHELTADNRKLIAEALNSWLMSARKKPVPDLLERLERFRKRIGVLAEQLELTVVEGQLVVKATGDAETTLLLLERGTDWFEPAGDVTVMVVAAIFE